MQQKNFNPIKMIKLMKYAFFCLTATTGIAHLCAQGVTGHSGDGSARENIEIVRSN